MSSDFRILSSMDILPPILFTFVLLIGMFLCLVGILFFFVPGLLIKWNALGNTLLGSTDKPVLNSRFIRSFFAVNYVLFTRHRLTGGVLWVLGLIPIALYFIYQ